MINPNDTKQFERIKSAVTNASQQLEPFRRNRAKFIREFVGHNFSDDGAEHQVPMNLIALNIEIVSRNLVASSPQVMVSTQHRNLKPQAADFGLAINQLLGEINFEDTMRRVVTDALFSIGILKKGITSGKMHEIDGILHDSGQPYADAVDLDDWVHDMSAKRWEQCQFMGNRYRLPLDLVKSSDMFTGTENLMPEKPRKNNEQGDSRVSNISAGNTTENGEIQDWIELWDIWLPRERLLVTYPYDMKGSKPIRVIEWDGPESGPYNILAFKTVPGSTMPLSPLATTYELHTATNSILRKIIFSAVNYKKIPVVEKGDTEDAMTVAGTDHMQFAVVDNKDAISEMEFNRGDGQQLALMMTLRDSFSWASGNLDSLGGLSPQSGTLGQDELLSASASQKIEAMQVDVVSFAREVIRGLGWWYWYDPTIDVPLIKRIAGTDIDVKARFSADAQEGDFLDYNVDIEPYSMRHQTPGMKMQVLTGIFERSIVPNAEGLAATGKSPNYERYLEMLAALSNTPEVRELISPVSPSETEQRGPIGNNPRQAANTTRTNIRVNRSAGTRSGTDKVIAAAALGSQSQPDEQAAAVRPNG